MAKIIKMKEHIISTDHIVWNLLIRENERPGITLLYDESAGLIANIRCSRFDQIEGMKKKALEEAKRNAAALMGGEPISREGVAIARDEIQPLINAMMNMDTKNLIDFCRATQESMDYITNTKSYSKYFTDSTNLACLIGSKYVYKIKGNSPATAATDAK